MSGETPDTVEVYKSKILPWIHLVVNHYDDIPEKVNVYYQDDYGAIHHYEIKTILEIEKMIRDENWIFVTKLRHQWFSPIQGGMVEK